MSEWKSAVDPNSGREYWYHRVTRVSTWTKPVDLNPVTNPPSAKDASNNTNNTNNTAITSANINADTKTATLNTQKAERRTSPVNPNSSTSSIYSNGTTAAAAAATEYTERKNVKTDTLRDILKALSVLPPKSVRGQDLETVFDAISTDWSSAIDIILNEDPTYLAMFVKIIIHSSIHCRTLALRCLWLLSIDRQSRYYKTLYTLYTLYTLHLS